MFRFTMKPSSGSHSQYLAKIKHLVHCEYTEVVQTLSVLWLRCVSVYAHTAHGTHTSQVILSSHNTDNFCTTSMYSH
jgi:hypothetical protein